MTYHFEVFLPILRPTLQLEYFARLLCCLVWLAEEMMINENLHLAGIYAMFEDVSQHPWHDTVVFCNCSINIEPSWPIITLKTAQRSVENNFISRKHHSVLELSGIVEWEVWFMCSTVKQSVTFKQQWFNHIVSVFLITRTSPTKIFCQELL